MCSILCPILVEPCSWSSCFRKTHFYLGQRAHNNPTLQPSLVFPFPYRVYFGQVFSFTNRSATPSVGTLVHQEQTHPSIPCWGIFIVPKMYLKWAIRIPRSYYAGRDPTTILLATNMTRGGRVRTWTQSKYGHQFYTGIIHVRRDGHAAEICDGPG